MVCRLVKLRIDCFSYHFRISEGGRAIARVYVAAMALEEGRTQVIPGFHFGVNEAGPIRTSEGVGVTGGVGRRLGPREGAIRVVARDADVRGQRVERPL